MGHLSIGDRRGWLLLILQPLSIIGLLIVALQLVDGTRWLIVLPPLGALLVAWLAQALHAYRRAVQLGAPSCGEIQAALFLPLAVAMLTVFWLVGGRHGSPAATLEAYVSAWTQARSDTAAALYAEPPATQLLETTWAADFAYLTERVRSFAATYGPSSGLDPTQPFDNLRFGEPVGDSNGRETVRVDIVRLQRVETMVLGIVPTASQETVLVEPAGVITLRLQDQAPPPWLSVGALASQAWRIESVTIGTP